MHYSSWTCVLLLLSVLGNSQASTNMRTTVEVDLSSHSTSPSPVKTSSNDTLVDKLKRNIQRGPSKEEREKEAVLRRQRVQERRNRARKTLASLSQRADKPPQSPKEAKSPVHRLTREEMQSVQRKTSWFGNGDSYSYNAALGYLADPAAEYDKWAQAYRMLGAFVDCDHQKSEGSGDNGGGGDGGDACSRWMMWASVSLAWIDRAIDRGKRAQQHV